MREIKFRLWEKNEDPSFDHMVTDKITISRAIWDHLRNQRTQQSWWQPHFSDPKQTYEIMQYSWLKDKNWVEIYEGDIVNIQDQDYTPETLSVVQFISNWFDLDRTMRWTSHWWHNLRLLRNYITVVWNIYQDPDIVWKLNHPADPKSS